MRIGVSVTSTELVAVAITHDGNTVTTRVKASRSTLPTQLERLLRKVISSTTRHQADGAPFIAFDVSGALLRDTQTPITVLRIAPRPPADRGHELSTANDDDLALDIIHIAGGHTILGEELVPLNIETVSTFAQTRKPGGRFVVTGVGSLVNPEHELRVGELLVEHANPSSVEFAHSFYSSAIAVRERTAITNSAFRTDAEALGTTLALVAGKVAPQARLLVTTNDGGCVPLARLHVAPVHSILAGPGTELIGAAAVCGIDDGLIVVADGTKTIFGEVISGVPTVVPAHKDISGASIATQTANITPATTPALSGHREPPLLLLLGATSAEQAHMNLSSTELTVHAQTDLDLRALGAASTPLVDWANRIVNVNNASEMEQALVTAQSRVKARLVSFGANPSQIRVIESRVIATAYQHPQAVSVRVRAVAGQSTGSLLRRDDTSPEVTS